MMRALDRLPDVLQGTMHRSRLAFTQTLCIVTTTCLSSITRQAAASSRLPCTDCPWQTVDCCPMQDV